MVKLQGYLDFTGCSMVLNRDFFYLLKGICHIYRFISVSLNTADFLMPDHVLNDILSISNKIGSFQ